MNKGIYKLTALTNMHPGSGDLSYGVIDKLVQRDPASGFPVIHASGMKGSIKKYWELYIDGTGGAGDGKTDDIFGSDKNPGDHKFLTAHLLTMPVRSNVKPFFRATCPAILEHLSQFLDRFGFGEDKKSVDALYDKALEKFNEPADFLLFHSFAVKYAVVIEDWDVNQLVEDFKWDSKNKLWFGKQSDFVILRDDIFVELCENLPVIARNRLIEPTNLWYEELIPRQSEFWFAHLWKSDTNLFNEIKSNPNPLQIGANATIGQGYCQITEIEKT